MIANDSMYCITACNRMVMIVSLVVTFNLESIGGACKLLLVTGAGTGTFRRNVKSRVVFGPSRNATQAN